MNLFLKCDSIKIKYVLKFFLNEIFLVEGFSIIAQLNDNTTTNVLVIYRFGIHTSKNKVTELVKFGTKCLTW